MDYPAYPPIFWNVEASRYATSLDVGNQPLTFGLWKCTVL